MYVLKACAKTIKLEKIQDFNLCSRKQRIASHKEISMEIAADWFPMYSLKCSNQKCFATFFTFYHHYIMIGKLLKDKTFRGSYQNNAQCEL